MKIYYVLNNEMIHAELKEKPNSFEIAEKYDYINELCEKLLSNGGERVAIHLLDVESEQVVSKKGKLIKYSEIVQKKHSNPHECHANSARYWRRNKDTSKLVTGYGLSRDTWISHTWVITSQKQIVETIRPFNKYFGAVLTTKQAEQFCINVLKKK